MIIGLTGTLASGKGEVAEYLKKQGFAYFSLSDEVREEAAKRGIEIRRENLQKLGNELRAQNGNGVLAQLALKKIVPGMNVIVDGIRNPAEAKELKNFGHFYLIATDAPRDQRFKRMMTRNRESDPKTWADFLKVDVIDQGYQQDESGQQVAECMKAADYKIINNASVESLHEKTQYVINLVTNKELLELL
jgi:dephospho-CoA kinase